MGSYKIVFKVLAPDMERAIIYASDFLEIARRKEGDPILSYRLECVLNDYYDTCSKGIKDSIIELAKDIFTDCIDTAKEYNMPTPTEENLDYDDGLFVKEDFIIENDLSTVDYSTIYLYKRYKIKCSYHYLVFHIKF